MKEQDLLVIEAARLARSSPELWERFVTAFRAYSALAAKDCIQSPLPELPRNQGRAQNTARLLDMFETCKARADKLEGR